MSRIAFITSRFPYPLEKGDKLRAYHHLRVLSENHDVILFALCDEEPTTTQLQALHFCKGIYSYRLSSWDRFSGLIRALMLGWPFQVGYFFGRSAKTKLHKDLLNENVDHLHVHMIRSHPYVQSSIYSTSIDYMDAMSASYQAVGQYMSGVKSWFYEWESKRLKRYEESIGRDYETRFAISARDADAIDSEDIQILANGIDLDYYRPRSSEPKKDYVLFLGNLGYVPNAQAIEHFVAVSGKVPDVHFKICGARAESLPNYKLPDNCKLVGWVDDSRDAYADALCLYAPIHSGAGQQNKVLEAMAMGIPVITTSFVQAGINAVDGLHLIVADDHVNAEQAILNLLQDDGFYNRLAQQGRTFVEDKFDWRKATAPLTQLIS